MSATISNPSPTAEQVRERLDILIADLFAGNRRGSIPTLDVRSNSGGLVATALIPAARPGDEPLGLEISIPGQAPS
jgi:hypothetical protein